MEIQVGKLIKKAKVNRCGDGHYPVLSMTMHEGLMFQNDRFKKQIASVDQSNYQVVKRHQLVESFPIDEGVLAVQELTDEGIVSPAYKIWDVNMDKVIPLYLELALRSPRSIEYYKSKLRGTTARRRSITDSEFCAMQINCPDLREQERIIEIITKAKDIAVKRQQELDTLDELIKARFVEMFGDPETNPMEWEQMTLNDVCSSVVRGPFGSALKKEFFVEPGEDTYKVYEQKHAIQKSSDIGTYYITADKYNELKRFECLPGDILMSCSGTMGELYQLPEGCERGVINQALCKFTLNEKILPICFLEYMRQTIGNLETKGSGIQNIAAVSYVKAMTINVPPIEVQAQFVRFFEQVDKSKVAVKKALDEAQLLFDSLMQEYFG